MKFTVVITVSCLARTDFASHTHLDASVMPRPLLRSVGGRRRRGRRGLGRRRGRRRLGRRRLGQEHQVGLKTSDQVESLLEASLQEQFRTSSQGHALVSRVDDGASVVANVVVFSGTLSTRQEGVQRVVVEVLLLLAEVEFAAKALDRPVQVRDLTLQ